MKKNAQPNTKARLITIKKHLAAKPTREPCKTVAEFISRINQTSRSWQRQDWREHEADGESVLNVVRIVGQIWFRGQRDSTCGLQPGLYRESTWKHLRKGDDSPKPAAAKFEDQLFQELFSLEHELRIDFTSFGHLLNEANHAKEDTDWYFLMQHHGVPTRLLDWTTNGLAALFFAAERYRNETEHAEDVRQPSSPTICVWMIDAYWLANRLSKEWASPMLAWSEDATRYIPPLKSLADKMDRALKKIPRYAMPIEPPALHPRVASQEGRFIIFGRSKDLLDEKIRLMPLEDGSALEELRVDKIELKVANVDQLLQELAQLGVSRRTLFPDLAGLADFINWKHFHKAGEDKS